MLIRTEMPYTDPHQKKKAFFSTQCTLNIGPEFLRSCILTKPETKPFTKSISIIIITISIIIINQAKYLKSKKVCVCNIKITKSWSKVDTQDQLTKLHIYKYFFLSFKNWMFIFQLSF